MLITKQKEPLSEIHIFIVLLYGFDVFATDSAVPNDNFYEMWF